MTAFAMDKMQVVKWFALVPVVAVVEIRIVVTRNLEIENSFVTVHHFLEITYFAEKNLAFQLEYLKIKRFAVLNLAKLKLIVH